MPLKFDKPAVLSCDLALNVFTDDTKVSDLTLAEEREIVKSLTPVEVSRVQVPADPTKPFDTLHPWRN